MSQEKSETMPMPMFLGVKEVLCNVLYVCGNVQVENTLISLLL